MHEICHEFWNILFSTFTEKLPASVTALYSLNITLKEFDSYQMLLLTKSCASVFYKMKNPSCINSSKEDKNKGEFKNAFEALFHKSKIWSAKKKNLEKIHDIVFAKKKTSYEAMKDYEICHQEKEAPTMKNVFEATERFKI